MFRSKELQFLRDTLAKERAERLDLLELMAKEREQAREDRKDLQNKLASLLESLIRPKPMVVPTSAVQNYPVRPVHPGYRPSTEPSRDELKQRNPEIKPDAA